MTDGMPVVFIASVHALWVRKVDEEEEEEEEEEAEEEGDMIKMHACISRIDGPPPFFIASVPAYVPSGFECPDKEVQLLRPRNKWIDLPGLPFSSGGSKSAFSPR